VTCKTRLQGWRGPYSECMYGVETIALAGPAAARHAREKKAGHINYFGVNGNVHNLKRFGHQAKRSWFKWLNRRSQRARLTWERFEDLLEAMPLPNARIVVHIWR